MTYRCTDADFYWGTDKVHHDKMISLVEQMLELNRKLADSKLAHEQTALERQIANTDRQIDNMAYELYGLTDEKINIVESSQGQTSRKLSGCLPIKNAFQQQGEHTGSPLPRVIILPQSGRP